MKLRLLPTPKTATKLNPEIQKKFETVCKRVSIMLTDLIGDDLIGDDLIDPGDNENRIKSIRLLPPPPAAYERNPFKKSMKDRDEGKFFIFPDLPQLQTGIAAICHSLLSDTDVHCVIHGPTQIGKALILAFLRNILPVLCKAIFNKEAIGIISIPSDIALGQSMIDEEKAFYNAFGECNLEVTRASGHVASIQLKSQTEDYLEMLGRKKDGSSFAVMRRDKHGIAHFISKLEEMSAGLPREEKPVVFLLEDEIDHGSDAEHSLFKELAEGIKRSAVLRIIGCTATPSEAEGTGMHIIKAAVPDNYRSFCPFYMGKPIRTISGFMPDRLPIHGIESALPLLAKAYFRQDHKAAAKEFIKFAQANLTNEFPGMFIRYSRAKQVSWSLYNELVKQAEKNPRLKIVRHFDNVADCTMTKQSLKSYLIDLHIQGYQTIVISTYGRTKRGDSLPTGTKFFFGMADKPNGIGPSYADTDIQADLGRGSGRNKSSVLYIWNQHANYINRDIATGGRESKRHWSQRADNTQKNGKSHRATRVRSI